MLMLEPFAVLRVGDLQNLLRSALQSRDDEADAGLHDVVFGRGRYREADFVIVGIDGHEGEFSSRSPAWSIPFAPLRTIAAVGRCAAAIGRISVRSKRLVR
jgi:hypothetical protein